MKRRTNQGRALVPEAPKQGFLYPNSIFSGSGTLQWAIPLILWIGLILALSGDPAGAAQDHTISNDRLPEIEVVDSDDQGVSLRFNLLDLAIETIAVDGRDFQLVTIPGGGHTGEIGAPAIPVFTRLVSIPDQAGVRVTVIVEEQEELSGYRLMPIQPNEGETFAHDLTAYTQKSSGTELMAKVGDPAVFRDLRVVPLTIRPVMYNPADGTLKIARRIRIDMTFDGVDLRNSRQTGRRTIPPTFARLYEDLVVNSPEFDREEIQPGTYLIICPNDSEVTSRLQPLVDWRERKGQKVVLATTAQTGTSTSNIKNYIQNVYDTSDPPLEFVCLAGDATTPYQIATWTESLSGYSGEGDHPYTQLEGGDILADVHLGRLTFNTLEKLEVVVAKSVRYESEPFMDTTDWFTRACVCGDQYNQTGYSAVLVNQWVKENLIRIGYTEVDTIWEESFVTNIQDALNRGDTIFSYRGWYGMSNWSNSYAYMLTNGWKMPFCVNITCDTGSFASGTAFSEGFLLAGEVDAYDEVQPAGGVGSIGTATIGTHTRYNNCMHYGIFQGLINEQQYEQGAALTRGKLEMYLNYNDVEPNKVNIWSHWNNLMGDPAVDIFTAVPQALTVTHPSSIARGSNSLTISVNAGATPIADAQVCLLKDGETHVVGYTDESGNLELPITANSTGDMLITVTKHNCHPYLDTVSVTDAALYVGYSNSNVDDDLSGSSYGNADGIANPGESVELPVQLQNFGSSSATGVTALLTCNDSYVIITDNSETFGDIGAGGTAWSADDFDFDIDPGCPHGHILSFGLDVDSGANDWHSLMELEVISAELVTESITLYNVGGNGIFDPGETGQISVTLRNNGGASAESVTGILESLSSMISVTDADGSFGTISAGGTGNNSGNQFEISADAGVYPGYLANFLLISEFSGGRRDTSYVGLVVGDRASDDPVGPDTYGYMAFDNTDVTHAEAPVYNWVEIDPAYGGDGNAMNFSDNANWEDESATVDIPFDFQYYGVTYDRATICTNGWLSMGSTYMVQYRNWVMPGAGGPPAMICPFWDDLYQSGGADVFTKYDTANNRWIIEWSRMRNADDGSIETFQAILYDPAHYPTGTGDGIIEFQYNQIANVDSGDGYATVGIDNEDSTIGLTYTYFNNYPAGAATLASGRAIRFQTLTEGPTGTVQGTVRNNYNNAPIVGATVVLVGGSRLWITGSDGTYGGSAPVGTFDVTADHAGFAPDTNYGISVLEDAVTTVDFYLNDDAGPILTTMPHPSTNDTNGPYPIPVIIEEYSGLDETTLYYRTDGGSFTTIPLVHQSGNGYLAEIPGQGYGTFVEYYAYARDGLSNVSTDPPGAPGVLYSFLISSTVTVLSDDFEFDLGWTVGAAGDDATTGVWERCDPQATEAQSEDDHTPTPGVNAYITQCAAGASQGTYDIDNGKTTLLSPVFDLSAYTSATVSYYRWYSNDTGASPDEDYWVVEVTDDGWSTWAVLENTNVTNRSWAQMQFDLGFHVSLTNQVQFRFIASDEGSGSIVEAGMDDFVLLANGIPDDTEPPAVTVVAPNGGEELDALAQFAITWTSSDNIGVTGTIVLLSTDGGSTYPDTLATLADETSFDWTVPDIDEPDCRIRVMCADAELNEGADISDDDFRIIPHDGEAPDVAVVAPNGGEELDALAQFAITWTSSDNIGVTGTIVLLSTDGGSTYPDTLAALVNETSFDWSVPDIDEPDCRIRVLCADAESNEGSDESDADFRIRALDIEPPDVTLTAPNGGEEWVGGSNQLINWEATDDVGVEETILLYSIDSGQSYPDTIATLTDESSFNWTVPDIDAPGCRVKVVCYDAAQNEGSDESDADFSIIPFDGLAPEVTVDTPNGGEELEPLSLYTITWTSVDNVAVTGTVLLLSTDGGSSYPDTLTTLVDETSFDWTVPDLNEVACRVKVVCVDHQSNEGFDESDVDFSISDVSGIEPIEIPVSLILRKSRPNPFAGMTRIEFGLPTAQHVTLNVYGINGQLVNTLTAGEYSPGFHTVVWRGKNSRGAKVANGLYFYLLIANGKVLKQKVLLLD